jgi:hypothetical protein
VNRLANDSLVISVVPVAEVLTKRSSIKLCLHFTEDERLRPITHSTSVSSVGYSLAVTAGYHTQLRNGK